MIDALSLHAWERVRVRVTDCQIVDYGRLGCPHPPFGHLLPLAGEGKKHALPLAGEREKHALPLAGEGKPSAKRDFEQVLRSPRFAIKKHSISSHAAISFRPHAE
jgi:hypothetical protein